ncbi:hypothetical protein [Lonsdalea iberica]|nr:hypothetical protein [Lonsdalea iberica]
MKAAFYCLLNSTITVHRQAEQAIRLHTDPLPNIKAALCVTLFFA